MTVTITVSLIIFSVFLHELGHALCMNKYGIQIKTFSIGLPFPLKISITRKNIFNGTTLQLTPLLLGAYVKPTREGAEKMNSLSYRQKADIYGAGPLANILFAIFLGMLYFSLVSPDGFFGWWLTIYKPLIGIIVFGLLFVGRKVFSRYLMIPIGVILICLTMWGIFLAPMQTIAGPIGVVKIVSTATNFSGAIYIATILSLCIGLSNLFPLSPLDGGQTLASLIGKYGGEKPERIYRRASTICFFLLIGFAMFSDFVNLAR